MDPHPNTRSKSRINATIKASMSILLEMKKRLQLRDPRMPLLYGLPKINKQPIMPGCQCSRLGDSPDSEMQAQKLQPLVGHTASYIKRSDDFVNKWRDIRLSTNYILVSFDVVSLFINIPTDMVLQVINHFAYRFI